MPLRRWEPWRFEDGVATRGITTLEEDGLVRLAQNSVTATAEASGVVVSGDALRQRARSSWLCLRHHAPALAARYSLKTLGVQYSNADVQQWADASIFYTQDAPEGQQQLNLLTAPVNAADALAPTTLHINERGSGKLDVSICGPHLALDGRSVRALLNQLVGWLKHGSPDDKLVWNDEFARLPLDIEYLLAGDAINDPPSPDVFKWIKDHPVMPHVELATTVSAPKTFEQRSEPHIVMEVLGESESLGLRRAAKHHGISVSQLIDGVAACAATQSCSLYAGSEQGQWQHVASYSSLDLRMRAPPTVQATTTTSAVFFGTLVPIELLRPAIAALEKGRVELAPIFAVFKANYARHLAVDSLTLSTASLQRSILLDEVAQVSDITKYVKQMPTAFPVTNVGDLNAVLRHAGQDVVHYDSVFASPRPSALPLVGVSTLNGRTKLAVQCAAGAFKDGWVESYFSHLLRYLRTVIGDAPEVNGHAH